MQQVNGYQTQQTIIYKLMESFTGLQKSKQNVKQSCAIHEQLQNDLYLKGLTQQFHNLKQFQSSYLKLKQLICQIGSNYEQLQRKKAEQFQQQSQLLKIQGQIKNTEIQMKSLSFQSAKKYDYKIHLKEANENSRKQLELILIEEKRLKDQKLFHQQIKTEKINILNYVKNQYKQLIGFNQQLAIQQIQKQKQVEISIKLLNQKLEEVNRLKSQKQRLQSVLEAAKVDNQNLRIRKDQVKTVKQEKRKTITELINPKAEYEQKKQSSCRLKSINEMNLKQMKLNYQSLTKNNQQLKAQREALQKEIISFQKESTNIQSDKTSLICCLNQNRQRNLMLKQQLIDNFKYIQKYYMLNQSLILESRRIIPSITQQQLQKMYYQRAKLYYQQNSQICQRKQKENLIFYY